MSKRKPVYNLNSSNYADYIDTGRKSSGISKDLDSLFFSELIKVEANKLYLSLELGQKRADSRKMAVVFCVYQAHLNQDLYYDIVHIGEKIGLAPEKCNKAISIYSKILASAQMATDNHNGEVDPFVMIRYYCGPGVLELNEEDITEIINLYEEAVEQELDINKPKKALVSSLIYLWIKRGGIPFDERRYLKAFPGVSMSKIKEIYKELVANLS